MRNFLNKTAKVLTGTATVTTLAYFVNSIGDNNLRKKLYEANRRSIDATNKLQELEKQNLIDEMGDAQLESYQAKIELSKEKITSQVSKIKDLTNENNTSELEKHAKKVVEEMDNTTNLLNEVIEIIKTKKSKLFEVSEDFIKTITDFYNQYNTIISDLTIQQLSALSNLLAAIFILLCLISIIVIIYSDFLLNYLKIEDKYPKLGKFIRLRRKFQQFYLFINLFLIIVTLFATIYVNSLYLLYM